MLLKQRLADQDHKHRTIITEHAIFKERITELQKLVKRAKTEAKE
jgi:hypothetical protein